MQNQVIDHNRRSFVVVLPDTDRVAGRVARLGAAMVLARHASGRPLLMGILSADRVVTGRSGETIIAVVGHSDATPGGLQRAADSARSPLDLSSVQAAYAGSFLTVGSVDGAVYASGQAMESRRLWTAEVSGMTVLSDRADVLAELTDAPLDHGALATRLLPTQPHPLDRLGLWRGITPLPGDRAAIVQPDGRSREVTWWSLPADDLGRDEGAPAFRDALRAAVSARTASGAGVTCDLSGGLDSTPICFLAAQTAPQGIIARTLFHPDPGGEEDLRWARKTLEVMPGVRAHEVMSTDEFVDFYEGIDTVDAALDEPTQAATAGPRIMALVADDAARGLSVHLNGLGGDHILRGVGGWDHTLARSRPLLAWRRARSEHIPAGTRPWTTLRQLTDRRAYREWLGDCLAEGATAMRAPDLNDWSSPLVLPSWLSEDARASVIDTVGATLEGLEPLHPTLAGHTDIYFVRDASRLVRGTAQLAQPFGVAYEAPLLDDRVVEVAFRVRRWERDTPLEWKPLMKDAMHGVLPDDYLTRTSKVGGGAQSVRGYARHHDVLVGLIEDAGLFRDGLIDRAEFLESTRPSRWETPAPHVHAAVNLAVFLLNQRPADVLAA